VPPAAVALLLLPPLPLSPPRLLLPLRPLLPLLQLQHSPLLLSPLLPKRLGLAPQLLRSTLNVVVKATLVLLHAPADRPAPSRTTTTLSASKLAREVADVFSASVNWKDGLGV
jgi:hypothetical protein